MAAEAAEHKYSEARCAIRLRPSRRAAWIVAGAALATEALLAAMPGDAAMRILAATWVACAALETLHTRVLLRAPRGARRVSVERSGAIEVEDARGRVRTGVLRAGSFVAPWLVIVRWQPAGARFTRTLPLIPGMASAEELRRLRVLLRWA